VLFAENRIELVLQFLAVDERELGGVEIPFASRAGMVAEFSEASRR